jgi:hypothetical protein
VTQQPIPGHDREECRGLHAERSKGPGIDRGLRRKIIHAGNDHRHVFLGNLLDGPRDDLFDGPSDRDGSQARGGDGESGAQDPVVTNHSEGRAVDVEDLDQPG